MSRFGGSTGEAPVRLSGGARRRSQAPMSFWPETGDLIRSALRDSETGWTLGAFGALASFRWAADEPRLPLADGRLGHVTPRGGIGLRPRDDLVAFAYETAFGAD